MFLQRSICNLILMSVGARGVKVIFYSRDYYSICLPSVLHVLPAVSVLHALPSLPVLPATLGPPVLQVAMRRFVILRVAILPFAVFTAAKVCRRSAGYPRES